jgi:hypothetical protein
MRKSVRRSMGRFGRLDLSNVEGSQKIQRYAGRMKPELSSRRRSASLDCQRARAPHGQERP